MTDEDIKKIQKVVRQEIKVALEPINNKLDTHTLSLVKIEQTFLKNSFYFLTPF
jgi:hypothetical protein